MFAVPYFFKYREQQTDVATYSLNSVLYSVLFIALKTTLLHMTCFSFIVQDSEGIVRGVLNLFC